MRIQRDVKKIWFWLPLILVLGAYVICMTANIILIITYHSNILKIFGFKNIITRLIIPVIFPVLLLSLYKIKSRGLHTTMAALNFAVIVISILFSWMYLANYFGIYGSYSGLNVLTFFNGFGSVTDLFMYFFMNHKFYYGLRLLADNMTVIAHFITLYCFIHFAQQDANPALYSMKKN